MPGLKPVTRSLNLASTVLLFLILLAFYLKAAAPSITAGDSPELITAAYRLGSGHPPGYPLYLLVTKACTLLPLGEIAWRANIANALLTALSATAVLWLICWCLPSGKFNWLLGLSGGFYYGFLFPVANQAVIAEVYPLFWLSLVLTLLALKHHKYRLPALLIGLGMIAHYTFLLTVPGLLILTERTFWRAKNLLVVCLLACLGLALCLYLPLRARQNPIPNWGNPDSWTRLAAKITLSEWHQRPGAKTHKSYGEKGRQLGYLLRVGGLVLHLALLLCLPGLLLLYKYDRRLFYSVLIISLILLAALTHVSTYPSWAESRELAPKFLVPLFLLLLFPLSLALEWLTNRSRSLKSLAFACCLLLPALAFAQRNFSWRWNFLAYDYGRNLLISAPADYYLAGTGDAASFPLSYVRYVSGIQPKIPLTGSLIFPPLASTNKKPLYTVMQVDERNQPYPAWRLFFVPEEAKLAAEWPVFYRLRGVKKTFPDMMSQFVQSKYYFSHGLYAFQTGNTQRGLADFTEASRLSRQVVGEHYNYGLLLKTFGQLEAAAAEFNFFLTAYPQVLPGYYQLGLVYEEMGREELARQTYQKILRRKPRFADVASRLVALETRRRNFP